MPRFGLRLPPELPRLLLELRMKLSSGLEPILKPTRPKLVAGLQGKSLAWTSAEDLLMTGRN